jgi:hypothetical protein
MAKLQRVTLEQLVDFDLIVTQYAFHLKQESEDLKEWDFDLWHPEEDKIILYYSDFSYEKPPFKRKYVTIDEIYNHAEANLK